MSNKFFSLINGKGVHIAPGKKVIPADMVATLVEAKQVLDEAQEDAEKYKIDVASECEGLKEQAQRDGYAAGFASWAEHVAQLEEEIIKVRKDFEKVLIPIALKAAKKIVGREIELSENTIVDIVSNSLKAVAQHKKITIYANKKDLEVLENHRNQLKQLFESLESLSLRERGDVKQGGCIIETEGGIINAQLDNQWQILETAFATLIKSKEGQK